MAKWSKLRRQKFNEKKAAKSTIDIKAIRQEITKLTPEQLAEQLQLMKNRQAYQQAQLESPYTKLGAALDEYWNSLSVNAKVQAVGRYLYED